MTEWLRRKAFPVLSERIELRAKQVNGIFRQNCWIPVFIYKQIVEFTVPDRTSSLPSSFLVVPILINYDVISFKLK